MMITTLLLAQYWSNFNWISMEVWPSEWKVENGWALTCVKVIASFQKQIKGKVLYMRILATYLFCCQVDSYLYTRGRCNHCNKGGEHIKESTCGLLPEWNVCIRYLHHTCMKCLHACLQSGLVVIFVCWHLQRDWMGQYVCVTASLVFMWYLSDIFDFLT